MPNPNPIRLTRDQFFAAPCPANGWEPPIAMKLFGPSGNDAAGEYELVDDDGTVRARVTILPRENAAPVEPTPAPAPAPEPKPVEPPAPTPAPAVDSTPAPTPPAAPKPEPAPQVTAVLPPAD